jgi:hypothetical protein
VSSPQAPTSSRTEAEASSASVRHRAAWAAGLGFAALCFGLWLYALFIYDPGLLVDELADRSFPRAAEAVCATHMEELDALPRAETAKDPIARADTIDSANVILLAMLGDLRPLAPTKPADANEAVNEWIDDWGTHLRDRQDYADRLREDPEARFIESVKGSKQVSRAIDGYAQVNRMRSCETPGDVG